MIIIIVIVIMAWGQYGVSAESLSYAYIMCTTSATITIYGASPPFDVY